MPQHATELESPKKHQQLFDEMLKRFNLSAKDLAQEANISEGMVSRFRQGKSDLTSANLIRMVNLLPDEARMWYVAQVFGLAPGKNWSNSISQASLQEVADILRVIADKYVQYDISEKTDSVE